MATTRKRAASTRSVQIISSDSEDSSDEFDKLVAAKSRKKTKVIEIDSDFEPSTKRTKRAKSATVAAAKPIKKVIVKTVTKKSTKKKIANDDDAGKEDDETTDDEMKVIPVPEKSDIDGIVASAPKAKKNAKASGSQLATMSSFSGSAWTDEQLLSELQHIDQQTCTNIIQLFNDDNTIPFMCRYRRELIGDLSPDQVRDIKVTYNHIQNIRNRSQNILKDLEKRCLLTQEIGKDIQSARSLDELEFLYAPFKAESKSSLSERAKALGLLEVSEKILHGKERDFHIFKFVNESVEGLETIEKITEGIIHIISQIMSTDTDVRTELQKLQEERNNGIKIHSTQSKSATKAAAAKLNANETKKIATKSSGHGHPVDESKFANYYDYQTYVNSIQPHQVLAINRGENLKVLTVKIVIPDGFKNKLTRFMHQKFFKEGITTKERTELLNGAMEEAYTKKLKQLITRQIRSNLTKIAETASIEVFAANLRQLLLLSPVKGKKILGIDPGFTNGCKVVLISECMDVLETTVIYPHTRRQNAMDYGKQIAKLLKTHGCDLIAVGNGTACRETESWLTELFNCGILDSNVQQYCIVNEQGASIYSCGDIAKKEFPNMDVNLISAVSIARRLSDPLAELVKVEPKHLGVGMYQHDVNEKRLLEALNEVVMECVSFVGVDVNTASATLLKHIAGLNATRAENIVQYRIQNGPFKSRDELKKVKGIGDKSFTQCAGFVRIEPLTAGIAKYNRLDSTWVHPESYQLANKLLKTMSLSAESIGSMDFIRTMGERLTKITSSKLEAEFSVPKERIESVLSALSRELFRDYRADFDKKPLFKKGVLKITDLREGTEVSGAISNITSFGCFIDIGVEKAGLLHVSEFKGFVPKIGDRINAIVGRVEPARMRIQLRLAQ